VTDLQNSKVSLYYVVKLTKHKILNLAIFGYSFLKILPWISPRWPKRPDIHRSWSEGQWRILPWGASYCLSCVRSRASSLSLATQCSCSLSTRDAFVHWPCQQPRS